MLPVKCNGHDLYIHLFEDLSFPYLLGLHVPPFPHFWLPFPPYMFENPPFLLVLRTLLTLPYLI